MLVGLSHFRDLRLDVKLLILGLEPTTAESQASLCIPVSLLCRQLHLDFPPIPTPLENHLRVFIQKVS